MHLTPSKTARGFALLSFTDRAGEACTLQESSLATEPAVWLGAETLDVRAFPSKTGKGWDPIDVAAIASALGYEDIVANTRMHLTQKQIIALLPALQHFAKHGTLPDAP